MMQIIKLIGKQWENKSDNVVHFGVDRLYQLLIYEELIRSLWGFPTHLLGYQRSILELVWMEVVRVDWVPKIAKQVETNLIQYMIFV